MNLNHAGILFALATTLSWSICIFPFTQAARRLGANPLNHFRLVLATFLLFLTALVINHSALFLLFSSNYTNGWIWLGLSGIVGLVLGDFFAFKMYAILGAKTGSVLTTFAPAAALIFARYLLSEHINFIGILGIVVTVLGVIAISFGKIERMIIPENLHGNVKNGVFLGILAALCQGAGLVLAKKGFLVQEKLNYSLSPIHATFIRMLISTIILFLFSIFTGKINNVLEAVFNNKEKGLKYAVAGTIFGPFLGVSLSLLTITSLEVAVSQTIFSLVPVFALFISLFFLKEKITLQSLCGMTIAIIGVFILIWRNELSRFLS